MSPLNRTLAISLCLTLLAIGNNCYAEECDSSELKSTYEAIQCAKRLKVIRKERDAKTPPPPETDADPFFVGVTANVNNRFYKNYGESQWILKSLKADTYSKSYFANFSDTSNSNLRMDAEISQTDLDDLAQMWGANKDDLGSFKDKIVPMISEGPQNSVDAFISFNRAKKITPNYQRPSAATLYNKAIAAINLESCPDFANEDQYYIKRVFEVMMRDSTLTDKFLAKYHLATMNKDPQAGRLRKCLQAKSS